MSTSHLPRHTKKDRSGAWSDAPLLRSGHTKRGVEVRASGPTAAACERATPFCPKTYLTQVGSGKTRLTFPKKRIIFSQGDAADAVFCIEAGKVKLTVVSQQGKEAVVAILEGGAFFGQSCLAGQAVRTSTAAALEDSSLVRTDRDTMIQVLHEKPEFAQLFMNRFKKLGYIEYKTERHAALLVHRSLLHVVLHD